MSRDFSRQSFLGPESERVLRSIKVAVIGAGGGGSHICQQLAHLGVENVCVVDDQCIDNSNLNRLVGGTWQDVIEARPKVEIADRVMKGVNPHGDVVPLQKKWQDAAADLRGCSVIFGCVDSFKERDEIETFARRFSAIYIDVGMDVFEQGGSFGISGQIFVSTPGCPCMKCTGIITEDNLQREAEQYGAAGFRPQVVWSNGVLASAAIGCFVELVSPWHSAIHATKYLEYDGNDGTMVVSNRIKHVKYGPCPHYPLDAVGDPYFKLPTA